MRHRQKTYVIVYDVVRQNGKKRVKTYDIVRFLAISYVVHTMSSKNIRYRIRHCIQHRTYDWQETGKNVRYRTFFWRYRTLYVRCRQKNIRYRIRHRTCDILHTTSYTTSHVRHRIRYMHEQRMFRDDSDNLEKAAGHVCLPPRTFETKSTGQK